jgi:hypothetical protein
VADGCENCQYYQENDKAQEKAHGSTHLKLGSGVNDPHGSERTVTGVSLDDETLAEANYSRTGAGF